MRPKAEYKQEIEHLYKLYHNDLVRIALCFTNVSYMAEDAVQETFRIACTKPQSLISSDDAKRWLIVTLKYVILNFNRAQKKHDSNNTQLYDLAVNEDFDGLELKLELQRYLSIEDYKLVSLIAFDNMTYKQAAEETGLTLYAFKQRLHRIRKRLKTYLGKDYANF